MHVRNQHVLQGSGGKENRSQICQILLLSVGISAPLWHTVPQPDTSPTRGVFHRELSENVSEGRYSVFHMCVCMSGCVPSYCSSDGAASSNSEQLETDGDDWWGGGFYCCPSLSYE